MRELISAMILAVFVVGLGPLAGASQKTDLSGTWTGFAERQGSQDNLTLVLQKKDNKYTGKLTDEMGMFPGVEVKNFVQKEDIVTFEFDGGMGGQVFTLKAELKLSGEMMKGTWTMIGADDSGAIELSRKK